MTTQHPIRGERIAIVSAIALIAIVGPPVAYRLWGFPGILSNVRELAASLAFCLMLAGFVVSYMCMRGSMAHLHAKGQHITHPWGLRLGLVLGAIGVLSFLLIIFVLLPWTAYRSN